MAALLRHRFLSSALVLAAAAGWLALSNHCALAAFESRPQTPAMPCHGSPAGNKPPVPGDQSSVECCKILRATLVTASVIGLPDSHAVPHQYVIALVPLPVTTPAPSVLELGTGPPLSFAESVLQRSVLAHAPPFFV